MTQEWILHLRNFLNMEREEAKQKVYGGQLWPLSSTVSPAGLSVSQPVSSARLEMLSFQERSFVPGSFKEKKAVGESW